MKRTKVLLGSLVSTLAFLPALAFAADAGNFAVTNGLAGFLTSLRNLMNLVVPILIGLAVIAFLFGVLKFVFNAGSEDARKQGRDFMIYGIIGIVVMVSVWGLVIFVQQTFGLQGTNNQVQSGPLLP